MYVNELQVFPTKGKKYLEILFNLILVIAPVKYFYWTYMRIKEHQFFKHGACFFIMYFIIRIGTCVKTMAV